MQSKTVKLTTGDEIIVFPPMSDIHDTCLKRYPDPDPPIVEEKTVSGSVIGVAIEDDPDYLKEKARMQAKRDKLFNELYTLSALRKVKVPDGWDAEEEFGEVKRYGDPDWQPREGAGGRKLDYIDFVFLTHMQDITAVQKAIADLTGIDTEAIDRIGDSFRGDVEEEAPDVLQEPADLPKVTDDS